MRGSHFEISDGTREMYHERVTAEGIMPHGKSSPDVVKNFEWSEERNLSVIPTRLSPLVGSTFKKDEIT